MADEKKVKKTKKKAEATEVPAEEAAPVPAPEPAAAEPAPPAEEEEEPVVVTAKLPAAKKESSSAKRQSSKRAQRNTSNVFDHFGQRAVEEYKAGFQFIDMDKDGIISKNDLRACYDYIGHMSNEKELDSMVAEAQGPINFTQMLTLFFQRLTSGVADDSTTIFNAFSCYKQDKNGLCDADKFREILQSGDDHFTDEEADACFDLFEVEEGKVNIDAIIAMLTGGDGEETEA